MGHLLSFIDTTTQCPPVHPPGPPEPPLPPARSINSSPKSASVVEDDKSLLSLFREWLEKKGYAVRIASNTEEGLRLFRDFAPFNVVLINYFVPQIKGGAIDCLAIQSHGAQLAKAIRDLDPSQGIIIVALDFRTAAEVPRPPEVMHIPLLIGPVNGQFCSLLEKIEVDRAIKALTRTDWLRLQLFAKFKIRGLGRAASGRDWEDLLAEALCRTLIGAEDSHNGRHWNKRVDFVQHLAGAISSIASVWKRQFQKETHLMSELATNDAEGQEYSPLDSVASGDAPADHRLIEKDELDRVLMMFKDDLEATHLLLGLGSGLKKNEIMSRYSLDEKKYAATARRIRVALRSATNRGKDNGR
ncbi:MAG: response regulator [Terriglobales bacterium]